MARITDPLIELLAIKLYEHDCQDTFPPKSLTGWLAMPEEDRELYRDIARGAADLPDNAPA